MLKKRVDGGSHFIRVSRTTVFTVCDIQRIEGHRGLLGGSLVAERNAFWLLRDSLHRAQHRCWFVGHCRKALGKSVQVINDGAMQALGSYRGGRMLFLGLGTGLGSAMAWSKTLMPLELGDLPYRDGKIIEQFLGKPGLARLGLRSWKSEVRHAVQQLKRSFIADYVVLGGGNAKRFDTTLPEGIELGNNRNAYLGGIRLWETEGRMGKKKWRVI